MTEHAGGATLYKRWRLKEGTAVDDVAALVRQRIVPHYARLSGEVTLGLERWDDRGVVAVQRWRSRAALEACVGGEGYAAWWDAYLPVLEQWDALVELEAEWEGEALL